MQVYIIIETVKSATPEGGQIQVSKYFETFAEAQAELQRRYENAINKNTFHQSVTTRIL